MGCGVWGVLQQCNGGPACFFFDLPLPPDAFLFSLLLLLLPFNFVLREHGGGCISLPPTVKELAISENVLSTTQRRRAKTNR